MVTNKELLDQMKKLEALLVPKQKDECLGQGDIIVPDKIKIEYFKVATTGGDGLGIVFNDGKQVLGFENRYGGVYSVDYAGGQSGKEQYLVKCKLVKTTWDDLKPGDTIFVDDVDDLEGFGSHVQSSYYKVLQDKRIVCVDDFGMVAIYGYIKNFKVYKVVKID